jgi:hypothetical protein
MDSHVFFAEHMVSQAHYVNGDLTEAVNWARRSYQKNKRSTSNMRILAASLVGTGDIEGARTAAQHHAELVPAFTLSAWAARTPIRSPLLEQIVDQLRVAGFHE